MFTPEPRASRCAGSNVFPAPALHQRRRSTHATRPRRFLWREERMKSIRAWLSIDSPETQELAPLRDTLEALDHLEPARARHLAAFAYLLGRVANADQY